MGIHWDYIGIIRIQTLNPKPYRDYYRDPLPHFPSSTSRSCVDSIKSTLRRPAVQRQAPPGTMTGKG